MIKPVIIIPCFNHANAFEKVAGKINQFDIPVIVVDDGSNEHNAIKLKKICTSNKFLLLRKDKNGGKGDAMICGFKYALDNGFTHALQIDADGQHDIRDIPLFLKTAQRHEHDLIIGNPMYDASAPKSRLIGRKITRFWVMVETFNKNMPDTMCGFRIYPLKGIESLLKTIKFKRMGFDIEIIIKAYRNNIRIISVPTRVIYPKDGTSNFHVFRDNFHIGLLHTYLCCLIPFWILKKVFKHEK